MIIEPGDMIILSPDIAITDAPTPLNHQPLTVTFVMTTRRYRLPSPQTHRHWTVNDNCQIARMLLEPRKRSGVTSSPHQVSLAIGPSSISSDYSMKTELPT